MSANTQQDSAKSDATKQSEPNTRVVHVHVPEKVFNYGKAQALLSDMSWPKFIEHLLANSQPINSSESS